MSEMENKHQAWFETLTSELPNVLYERLNRKELDHYIGLNIPPYKITSLHDVGGFSAIFIATREDKLMARDVIIKMLLPEFSQLSKSINIGDELNNVAKLNHSNIAHIYDAGRLIDDEIYFVMELIDGKNIVDYVKHHNLSLIQKISLFSQLCRAMQYAHEKNIIHNDIKPSNVFVDSNGMVKILDFGISINELHNSSSNTLLGQYAIACSVPYASPEQVSCSQVSRRSDIYSAAMLFSSLLLEEDLAKDVAVKEVLFRLSSIVPNDLVSLIAKCLKKKPQDRYHSFDSVVEDLTRLTNKQPVTAHPYSLHYVLRKFITKFPIFSFTVSGLALATTILSASLYTSLIKVEKEKDTAQAFSSILKNVISLSNPNDGEGFRATGDKLIHAVTKQISKDKTLQPRQKLVLKAQVLMSYIQNDRYDFVDTELESLTTGFTEHKSEFTTAETQFISVVLAYCFNRLGDQEKSDFYIGIAKANKSDEYPASPAYVVEYLTAYSLSNKSKYEDSIAVIENALAQYEIKEKKYLSDMHYLASVGYRELGKTQLAIDATSRAIEEIKAHPTADSVLSYYYSNLARAQVDISNYKQAEANFNKALELSSRIDGEESQTYMVITNDAASLYLNTEQFAKSLIMYEKVYHWIVNNYGLDNTNAATMALNICLSHQGLNDSKMTMKYCQEAERTFSDIQVDHLYRLRSLLVIAEQHIENAAIDEAKKVFDEVSKYQEAMTDGLKSIYESLLSKLS